jgi:putative transposase
MRRTFRYRLYPNRTQARALEALLDGARGLYNAALEQRRTEWQWHRHGVRYLDQAKELKAARNTDPVLALLNYSSCQDVLRRLDKAFSAFFRRCKSGETPGYPRFKGKDRFNSVTFPKHGDGIKLGLSKLYVQNVGPIRIKLHRPIEGKLKTVTLRREASGHWYACCSCDEVPARTYAEPIHAEVGIDMGLTTFATLSNGEEVENPRWYRKTEERLAEAQRLLATKQKGTSARRKAKGRVARLHEKASEQRRDFQHKLAHRLVSENALIAVEDLKPSEMLGRSSGLTKSILDAAWRAFLTILSAKAEEAGRTFVKVPPRGTSSTCSGCGAVRQKALGERVHRCEVCGLVVGRDLNAALNILALGRSAGLLPSEARSRRL